MTPMMVQYNTMKAKSPDAVLFFRMGDFYEMFGEDAKLVAPILEIALTSRDKNAEDKMPMCGVPHHSVDSYIARLVERNFKVAICDQVEDPKTAKGIVKRDIVRVITPGTLLETNLLEAKKNNYLSSCCIHEKKGGLALLDLSTGEFSVTEISNLSTSRESIDMESALVEELLKWSPRELILPDNWTFEIPRNEIYTNSIESWVYSYEFANQKLCEQFQVNGLEGFGLENSKAAIIAAGALLHYLENTHIESLKHINKISLFHASDFVYMDTATKRNLELTETIMGGKRTGSVLHYIDQTITPMGARLLKNRLEKPLRNVDAIQNRLTQVEVFYQDDSLRNDLRDILSRVADLERLVTRVVTRIAHARDLAALRESFAELPAFKNLFLSCDSDLVTSFVEDFDVLSDIYALLNQAIRDNPSISMKDGNIIREGYNSELDELRVASREGKKWIANLQEAERERTKIQTLKVRFNKVFGYFIEITKSQLSKVPEDYIRRQTLVNAERFVTPELKKMESKILGSEERMIALETELFSEIRDQVGQFVGRIQKTAKKVGEMDVAAALGELAVQHKYRRPIVSDDDEIEIEASRHPVVERMTEREGFVPNDLRLNTTGNRLVILTGPNMAGKSTYIRQVALNVLLAQMGSFIPADSARIGIVDRIFTRVGASDNLAAGQSTFMVEMSEAANILNNATNKSLIILDEIGRGTSTFDGLSIAWAVAEFLYKRGARTLFATHYHELIELAERFPGVKNYNVEVKEWNDKVIFLRKVVPGGVDRSYGIQVARLAGIPDEVIQRAKEVLCGLERENRGRVPEEIPQEKQKQPMQLELFALKTPKIINELKTLNTSNITPLEALILLDRWKQEYGH